MWSENEKGFGRMKIATYCAYISVSIFLFVLTIERIFIEMPIYISLLLSPFLFWCFAFGLMHRDNMLTAFRLEIEGVTVKYRNRVDFVRFSVLDRVSSLPCWRRRKKAEYKIYPAVSNPGRVRKIIDDEIVSYIQNAYYKWMHEEVLRGTIVTF
jgi:hypothetical protein